MHGCRCPIAAQYDVFIATAAVADWRPAAVHAHKIKKEGITAPQIAMTENPDILRAVAQLPQPPYCVGFAAETEKPAEHAEAKPPQGHPADRGNPGPPPSA